MYRFFVEGHQIAEGFVTITGPDVNHIEHVLRMKAGEEIRVSDGEEDYYCILRELLSDCVRAEVCYQEKGRTELPSKIVLFQGLPKGDKMELIIQKAVELGVWEIVPVAMSRSVVKLDPKKAEAKRKRWQAIAESAAKQSKRIIVPQVGEVLSYKQALAAAKDLTVKLLPYENQEGMTATRKLIEGICPGQSIGVIIGPEGGFAEEEVELAREAGFLPITLGKRILRTETAGLTMLSILMYQLEDREETSVTGACQPE